jgi:outer membrane biogenesis lipoprotein LolB
MAGLALILGVTAFFLPAIPPAQRYLKMFWLQQPVDYAIVAAVVLGWALALGLTWWLTGRPTQAAEIGARVEV